MAKQLAPTIPENAVMYAPQDAFKYAPNTSEYGPNMSKHVGHRDFRIEHANLRVDNP